MPIESILANLGLPHAKWKKVQGGDINDSYCIEASNQKYFLKVNDAGRYPGMFKKERNGLELLHKNFALVVPRVSSAGESGDKQFLLLDWLEAGHAHAKSWDEFGRSLAQLHSKPAHRFGFEENNYIGNLTQLNNWSASWQEFYAEFRVLPMVKRLFERNDFDKTTVTGAHSFCARIEELFPKEPPSLLHGDLWSGNFLFDRDGRAAIYDPAVYYGHREMDIGMTKLFGGFHSDFYLSYNEHYPLQKGWEKRLTYSQLYPLLVHAILFGGHYISQCRETFALFL